MAAVQSRWHLDPLVRDTLSVLVLHFRWGQKRTAQQVFAGGKRSNETVKLDVVCRTFCHPGVFLGISEGAGGLSCKVGEPRGRGRWARAHDDGWKLGSKSMDRVF